VKVKKKNESLEVKVESGKWKSDKGKERKKKREEKIKYKSCSYTSTRFKRQEPRFKRVCCIFLK